jgi:hypothetical protein
MMSRLFTQTSKWLSIFLPLAITLPAVVGTRAQSLADPGERVPFKAEVQIFTSTGKSSLAEKIRVTFQIKNTGSTPFYIPQRVDDLDTYGGFAAIISGPADAKLLERKGAVDFPPGKRRNIVKEVEESWLLLFPGDFYGGVRTLHTTILSPGTYRIVARRNPPRLTEEEKERVRTELKFPVLLEPIDSKPASLVVTR